MESRSSGRDRETAEFDRIKAQKSRSRVQETTVDRPDRTRPSPTPRYDVSPRRSTGPLGADNRSRRDGGTGSGYNSSRYSPSPASYGGVDRRASPDYARYRPGESRGSRPSSPPRRSYDDRGYRSPRRDHTRNARDRSPPSGYGRNQYQASPRPDSARYRRSPSPANRPSRSPLGPRLGRRLSDSPPPYRAPRPQNPGYKATPNQTGSELKSGDSSTTQSADKKRPTTIRDFVPASELPSRDGPRNRNDSDIRTGRYNRPESSGKRRRSIERDGNTDGTGKRARVSDRDFQSEGQISKSKLTGAGNTQNAQVISSTIDSQGNPSAPNDAMNDDAARPAKTFDADEEIARRRNRRLQMRARMIVESSGNGNTSTPTSLQTSVVSSAATSPSLPQEMSLGATSMADRTNSFPPSANFATPPVVSSQLSSPPVVSDLEMRVGNDAAGATSEVQAHPNGRPSAIEQEGTSGDVSSSGVEDSVTSPQPNSLQTPQQVVPSVEPSDHHDDDEPSAPTFDEIADEDDLFGDNFVARPAANVPFIQQKVDSLDNEHEYYKTTINELIEGRYVIREVLGHGSYAEVMRAYDNVTDTKVALKMFRNNPFIFRKGLEERNRLNRVADADIDGTQSHIIRLEHHFIYKQHLCFVMENMDTNLDKYVKSQGIKATSVAGKSIRVLSLPTIRKIAFTIFNCLKFLRDHKFVHGDIKPENILINLNSKEVKIGDLGTLHDVRDSHMEEYKLDQPGTPIFMAPEIHLMVTHDFAIDTWAVGCTLYELFMGSHLFHGDSIHGLLRQIQQNRGPIGRILLNNAQPAAVAAYFTDDRPHRFKDPVTGAPMAISSNAQYVVQNDMRNHYQSLLSYDGYPPTNKKDVEVFIELVDRCLQLDPAKRIKPNDALQHEFFNGIKG